MGKRRSRASTGTPAAKRTKPQWSSTIFGRKMEETGMNLGGTSDNELTVAPALFQRKLAVTIKTETNTDKVVREFIESLTEYCDDAARFRMSLLPTKIACGADIVARLGGLDSVMRLLLGIEALQPSVVDVLLEKLPEYMDNEGEMEGIDVLEYHQMAKLILNQFRWLDHLVNGKELCSKLLEVSGIAPVELQREIITALPEILDDPQHNDAAVELKSLLQTKYDLTSAIIDALSNMTISSDTAAEVLDVALDSLQSSDLADLPTVIKYIMQYVTAKNAQELISELRIKLDLDCSPFPIISSTPLQTQAASRKHDSETSDYFVVFDTIRSSICFQKSVAEGWIKAIQAVTKPADHRPIDLFVLFILHSIPARKKAVFSLFSDKIKARCFTEDLMNSVFGSHTGALREYFPDVLSLCESLLCSASPSVSLFAVSLYQHLFSSFDKFCQQEVVVVLMNHISNGGSSEVNHALDILTSLVEHRQKEVSHFSVIIKGALDYLEHLSVPQLRKIYHILSVLGFHDDERGSPLQDELDMIIRKQLRHAETMYRHMGIIGSVMVIRQIAHQVDVSDMTMNGAMSSQLNTKLSDAKSSQAKDMLERVMRSCVNSPESMILFCEEMSSVVESLDHDVLSHLSEQVTSKFQDDFLMEVTDPLPTDLGLSLDFLHSLDSTEDGSIGVNLLPMIVSRQRDSLRGMSALFKLVRVCEQALHNNLEGIDALLGCSVVMCADDQLEKDTFEELPLQKRHDICLSIFHCLNWFRELVCAFAGENDPDMKGKVIIRLTQITKLQDTLETCMTLAPGFWPPCVNVSEAVQPTKGKKGGKSSKSEVTLASITAATINIDKDTTAVDKAASSTPAVPIDRLRPYFRKLDLGVFKTLHYGALSRTLLDSENHTKEREELRIDPPQLVFLLQDLNNKLSSVFSVFGPKGTKSGEYYTADELVKAMATIVVPLCEQLENTSAFFQAQLADNDGMVDVDCHHKDYPHLVLCFHLLLKALATFFSWSSLSDPLYSDPLKKILASIISRTTQSFSQSTRSLPELAKRACQYLRRFSEFVPTLSCGHSLAKVLVAVCRTCKADHFRTSIASVCGEMLCRPWRVTESKQLCDDALNYLLKYHIEWASEPLLVIETIAGECAVELIGEDAREASQTYSTLTDATFACYYRVMSSALVNCMKSIPILNKSNLPTDEELYDSLHLLELSAKVFYILVNLVKSFDKKQVLTIILKNGRKYVDVFLKTGMPVVDLVFRPRKDDVIAVLKTLQQSTRCLHHYCSHSKVEKDTRLVNHVPPLKRSLEILVFKVKELMTNHNCREAFQVGNLKNRDIKGQEILSQISQQSSEAEEREEDEGLSGEDDGGSTSTDRRSKDDILDTDSDSD